MVYNQTNKRPISLFVIDLMSKAQTTRAEIIHQAAALFNQRGYAGASIADIMAATGLKKGGIYNHFHSKDELAIASFNYAVQLMQQRYAAALRGQRSAKARLQAMINTFCEAAADPPIPGGCPILNTAIESDHTHPALRQCAQQAMDQWQQLLTKILRWGIEHGEVRGSIDPATTASLIIALTEGAVMMSQLYGDRLYLERARQHLLDHVETLLL
jgi:TetR/AcrR family transcriptional regulator, transcriptional repressor for nem operon